MKGKILATVLAVSVVISTVPLMARGYGKGYMGGRGSSYSQPAGTQTYNGYGDGTMPRPMNGTGFGANYKANGHYYGHYCGHCYSYYNSIDNSVIDETNRQ